MSSIRRIAVVTGGRSNERDRSLISGEAVHESLTRLGLAHVVLDPSESDFTERIRTADVAFLAIAGQWAEDGKLQGLLESLSVPYTGSGVMASALGMHKPTAKNVVRAAGVSVLPHLVIRAGDDPEVSAKNAGANLGFPLILKPCSEGGSIGMQVFRDAPALAAALVADNGGGEWLIEPFTDGTAVTCGVITSDGDLMALPPLETLATTAEFYDYTAKRDPNGHRYRCPAELSEAVIAAIQRTAIEAHQALGCHSHSRSDFMVTPVGEVFWLEVNTLPGLSPHGNLATMANAAGISYDRLITAILTAAHHDGYRP
ncbi:D-alanine--D-alanine ligase [Kitasatospora sp. GP82]|uniref:D-alanine--D-alanine ligase family protein n=1 Tax=Kitasatospora sp. GP82 TaxID=3035089 RepID=UPI0024762C88|nr:D-alanine--D-alanine ligase [Kitasatospora sp. GP82]MDH6130017.1 D-alanine-D-alanine ligase [Kitasatospora sp. GP82]